MILWLYRVPLFYEMHAEVFRGVKYDACNKFSNGFFSHPQLKPKSCKAIVPSKSILTFYNNWLVVEK